MTDGFTFGSLFAGIGGFDLGLERAGMRCVWQCEIDSYCQRVLAKHWPDVLLVPDIREIRAGTVPRVDVLCGGFPCQDLSLAGKGAGIDGARSGLWSEYARVVRELRPRYVIVENVPALLGRGLGRVVGDLAACGYDTEWDCLPASAFGAPHQRDRVWLVAYPGSDRVRVESERDQREGRQVREAERGHAVTLDDGASRPVADADESRLEGAGRPGLWEPERDESAGRGQSGLLQPSEAVADTEVEPVGTGLRTGGARGVGRGRSGDGGRSRGTDTDTNSGRCEVVGQQEFAGVESARGGVPDGLCEDGEQRDAADTGDWWSVEPDVGRVADGVPARVDRLRSLGNALIPQIAQWIGEQIMRWEA